MTSGDVVYFDVFGQPVITLNSFEAIEDLIIKKSALFSGRPYLPMVTELYAEFNLKLLECSRPHCIALRCVERVGSNSLAYFRQIRSGKCLES